MSEAQILLEYIKGEGGKDYEVAELTGVSRPTVCKIRSGNYPDYTGETIPPELRRIASKLGYRTAPTPPSRSQPRAVAPAPRIATMAAYQPVRQPRPPQPKLPSYRTGTRFICQKCRFPNTARATNSYCVSCESAYIPT